MRRCGIGALFLVVALALAAPAHASPVSSHAMVHSCCTPFEHKERAFAESKALGASFIRVDVELGAIFDSFGVPRTEPDWRGLDEVIALSRRYQLPVLGIVLDTPAYISDCPERWPEAGRCGAREPGEYGRLAGEVAARARGVVTHWEIVNEPDGAWAFEGSAEQYARMLAASHDAIKARAPEAAVVMGGVMTPSQPGWAERVFATPGANAARRFDVANVHLRGPIANLPTGVRRWRELLGRHGFGGPMWVTEHGYSADPAFQQDPAFVGGEAQQAGYLKRSLLTLTEAGAEQVFVTLRDNPDLEPNYVLEGVAVLHGESVRRKPAFGAVADFSRRYPEIRALLARQRAHERSAAALATQIQADERRLQSWRSARHDVRSALASAQRALRRPRTARTNAAAKRRLAYAKRVVPRLRKRLKAFDGQVRAYAQRLSGNRLEASQHVQRALDCARRIEG